MCPDTENVSGNSSIFPHFPTIEGIEKATDFNAFVDFSGFSHSLWWRRQESNLGPSIGFSTFLKILRTHLRTQP